MSEPEKSPVILECSGSYQLGDVIGEAVIRLDEENLSLLPKFAEPLFISFRDIYEISEQEYRLNLKLNSGEKLIIFDLGYKYEDFLRILSRLRNAVLLQDLLMTETLKKTGVEAEYEKGKCELRLYETALVIIPEKGELTRIPYSDISEVKNNDFVLTIKTESGKIFSFRKLGNQYDSFVKIFSGLMNELSLKVQSTLKELLPRTNPLIIRKISRFMREGKAARRSDIESISPELWTELEKKLEVAGIKEEYDFLKSLGQKEKMCIGLKRGLLGDLTGEYIWFLVPIYHSDHTKLGNAIALEATAGEDSGRATYFFRIVSRKDYPHFPNIEELNRQADEFIKNINRCMLAINFRREPVYLPEEKLDEPRYQKYKFAIARIPELQQLRKLFIGRIIHTSLEQWKNDVLDLLKFNSTATDDNQRWEKNS